jgi:IS30 family transposase
MISHETIYRFIYSPQGKQLSLHRHLVLKRRFRYSRLKRRRNMVTKQRKRMITTRPKDIDDREEYGNWEGDLVLFRQTKTNLFTLRE